MISKMIVCLFRHADDTDSVSAISEKSLHASSMADTISGCLCDNGTVIFRPWRQIEAGHCVRIAIGSARPHRGAQRSRSHC
jgi:hypothetical protein